jgi:hypothetical protein
MKKILLILLLTPFISFGQIDSTIKKYNILKKDTSFFKSLYKYVSISKNLSFYQSNYNQLEFGAWIPNDPLRVALTLDNSESNDVPSDYWIGIKSYYEVSELNQTNSFFLYLHPKLSNYLNGLRLNYGISYIRDKEKRFSMIGNLNFEETQFILSLGLNYTFR